MLCNYQLPGGFNDKKPNLKNLSFTIDQEKFARYTSSKQNNVNTGTLMKSYQDTLINLTALQSRDLPKFYYDDYKEWSFINGNYQLYIYIIYYFPIAYRTTPVETSLNYMDQQSHIKIPVSIKCNTKQN